jgi:cob(I)alamin adenosyltransferase
MSIVTKTGDLGTTGLMYNRRVPKSHPRVESYGAVDEMNAALGMARALAGDPNVKTRLLDLQKELIRLMGELATAPEDLPRYEADGFKRLDASMTAGLDQWVVELEAANLEFKGWAMPGENPAAAALDVARTTCRRAERRICALQESGQLDNTEIIVYLNRLSDLLWLLARHAEHES